MRPVTVIALIDVNPTLRMGLNFIIKTLYNEAELIESENVNSFYEKYPQHNPKLIVLAIGQHPVESNLSIIKKARRCYSESNIIVYDEQPDPDMVAKYLNSGIQGYLSKRHKITELVDCILEVMGGMIYVKV